MPSIFSDHRYTRMPLVQLNIDLQVKYVATMYLDPGTFKVEVCNECGFVC